MGIEKHNCKENMKLDGEYEFIDEEVIFRGECSVCGRKMVETFSYVKTTDEETDKELK